MAPLGARKRDSVYSSEVGLFYSFELRGKWWLPDAPDDRVHGTVTYSPAQRITLRLDGKFQHPKLQNIFFQEPFKCECILGETVEEEFVTLHSVFASRVSRTDTFIASSLVVGQRFSRVSDLLISGALIGYTNLEEWACSDAKDGKRGQYRILSCSRSNICKEFQLFLRQIAVGNSL
jgi:hypothetical protein